MKKTKTAIKTGRDKVKQAAKRSPPKPKTKEYIKVTGRKISNFYTPMELESLDLSTVKKIYSELRPVVQKRLKRQEVSEYNKSSSYQFYSRPNVFKTIKQMEQSSQELPEVYQQPNFLGQLYGAIIDAQKYLSRGGILYEKEQNEKLLATMREKGGAYAYLNEDNIKDFGRFMETLREKYDLKRKSLASDRVAQLYAIYEKTDKAKDIMDMFQSWLEDEKSLTKLLRDVSGNRPKTPEQLKEILTRKEKKYKKSKKYGAKRKRRK